MIIILVLALVMTGTIALRGAAAGQGGRPERPAGAAAEDGTGLDRAGTGIEDGAADDPAEEKGETGRAGEADAQNPAKDGNGEGRKDQTDPVPVPDGSGSAGFRIVSAEEFADLRDHASARSLKASDLRWEGMVPAFDAASATIMIPCDPAAPEDKTSLQTKDGQTKAPPQTKETGTAEGEAPPQTFRSVFAGLAPAAGGAEVVFQEDEYMRDLSRAVREGHAFSALLVSGTQIVPFQLVAGGLPVLCLDQTDPAEIVQKENHEGEIRLMTADKTAVPLSEEIRCRFHVRGNISSTLEKKPWKLSLLNAKGEQKKAALLDLRRDDDWILNPLFTDFTRVREMTAYALWDRTTACADHPMATSRMRYVELFLNDAYQGIYGLQEPVDKKQLRLSTGDLLYKIDRWDREYPYLDLYGEKEGELEICNDSGLPCVEIRFPKEWDQTATWAPMQAFHEFTFRSKDLKTLTQAGLETDMDSVVSMSLYCAMTHAMDNTWKNSFVAALRREEGGEGEEKRPQYDLYRTIWDLNYVFGDVFVYEPEEGYTVFDGDTARAYTPLQDSTYDYEAFRSTDPALQDDLAAKWKQWRESGIDADLVCSLAEENMEVLRQSGALRREILRWGVTPGQPSDSGTDRPEAPALESLSDMEDWIRSRFTFLDAYFGE